MGQTIEIRGESVIERVLVIDTDRSLTGQNGESYSGQATAKTRVGLPAELAVALFESDRSIDHVHVMGNVISVRRLAGWTEESRGSATGIVSRTLLINT